MGPRRAGTLWALAFLTLAAASPAAVTPPLPDLEAAEPAVRQALESGRQAVLEAPESAAAWGDLGMLFQAHSLTAEAVTSYRRARELAPRDARWPYLEALTIASTDPVTAAASLRAALALGWRHPALFLNLSSVLLRTGDLEGAEQALDEALALAPDSPFVLVGLGRLQLLRGEATEAAALVDRALSLDWGLAAGHSLMAQILQRQGDRAAATRHAAIAASLERLEAVGAPDPLYGEVVEVGVSSRWLIRRSRALLQSGQAAAAVDLLRDAAGGEAPTSALLASYAKALEARGERDEALRALERCVGSEPEFAPCRHNRGTLRLRAGDLEGARLDLEAAAELEPDNLDTAYNLALIAARQERLKEAGRLVAVARALDPADVLALNLAADLARLASQDQEARRLWQESLAVDPRQERLWSTLAAMAAAAGDHAGAVATLRAGREAMPGSVSLKSFLAWELATAPDPEVRDGVAALALATEVLKATPLAPQSSDILAAALAEMGDFEAATRVAKQALNSARSRGMVALARDIDARLAGYAEGQAFRLPVADQQ